MRKQNSPMKKMSYFLVGIKLPDQDMCQVEESMKELEGLVRTAGGDVLGTLIQNRSSIDPATYIGKGKLDEVDLLFDHEEGAGAVVFNAGLSPAQVRNVEKILERPVITRTELILDIFAVHAKSQISKLQVETAQLNYMLPRLVGQGKSLSRLGGGIGTRGPGETKLETDRRKINARISLLRRELKALEKSAGERRKTRDSVFKIAVAGYTNAGKSSLSSRLVRSALLVEDKLFSTLDTTTRRLSLGAPLNAVLTDTVGFIQDIPHELVESFKSTLAETVNADLIIHTVDASSLFFRQKIETARSILDEIQASAEEVLVFNKIDLISSEKLMELRIEFPDAFFVSAKEESGLENLKTYLRQSAEKYLLTIGQGLPSYFIDDTL